MTAVVETRKKRSGIKSHCFDFIFRVPTVHKRPWRRAESEPPTGAFKQYHGVINFRRQ